MKSSIDIHIIQMSLSRAASVPVAKSSPALYEPSLGIYSLSRNKHIEQQSSKLFEEHVFWFNASFWKKIVILNKAFNIY